MKTTKREWDLLSKDRRTTLIREIAIYFKSSHDSEIGMLASEDILDYFLQALGGDLYRHGVDDAKTVIKQNAENLEVDLDLLTAK